MSTHLINDRTQADVDRAMFLLGKLANKEALTVEEQEEYFDGLRGCYSLTDLTRVTQYMQALAERFNIDLGFSVNFTSPSIAGVTFTQSQIELYLDNLQDLLDVLKLSNYLTAPPISEWINFETANRIEDCLKMLDKTILSIIKSFQIRQANTLFMQSGGIFNA